MPTEIPLREALAHSGRGGTPTLFSYVVEPSMVDFGYKWGHFSRFLVIVADFWPLWDCGVPFEPCHMRSGMQTYVFLRIENTKKENKNGGIALLISKVWCPL